MKFLNFLKYINESFEDKLFTIIDDFIKDDIYNDNTFKRMVDAISKSFGVTIDASPIFMQGIGSAAAAKDYKEVGGIGGSSNYIGVSYYMNSDNPNHIDNNVKISILGVIFHELAHQMQSTTGMKGDYIKHKDGKLLSFTQYYLQPSERVSKALSDGLRIAYNNIDYLKTLSDIRNTIDSSLSFKKNYERIQPMIDSSPVDGLCNVGFLISAIDLLKIDKSAKNKLLNQYDVFMKNLDSTVRKLSGYLKRFKVAQ
jgi:hypothetical protein